MPELFRSGKDGRSDAQCGARRRCGLPLAAARRAGGTTATAGSRGRWTAGSASGDSNYMLPKPIGRPPMTHLMPPLSPSSLADEMQSENFRSSSAVQGLSREHLLGDAAGSDNRRGEPSRGLPLAGYAAGPVYRGDGPE